MSFYAKYPISGGGGVTSLDGLTGDLTLVAGAGIDITDNGTDEITISSTSGGDVTIGVPANGLSITAGQILSLGLSSTSTIGALSATDWNTFNNKQAALTLGNLTAAGTDGIAVTGGAGAVIGSGTSLAQHVADSTHNGYLSSVDWVTFNSKQAAGNYITALTGDGTASGPGSAALTLATVNSNVGSFGSATQVAGFTVNAKGLVTAASNTSIQIAESQVTNLVSDLAGKQATGNYITALTGDITATGPGSVAATLATVNSNIGTFASFTVNGKGLITAATALSGDITSSSAVTTLATVNSNVGSFTNASVTVNAKGLVTAASSGSAPVTTLAAVGASPNANAATLSSNTLNLEPASASFPGVVTTGAQTLAGVKTISSAPVFSSVTASQALVVDSGKSLTSVAYATANTASALAQRDANKNLLANNMVSDYTTIVTAAGTTTLTVASTYQQFFTGATTQTLTLPVASTLTLGHTFYIRNNSSGVVTVNSSGANLVQTMAGGSDFEVTCILASGTSAASWSGVYSAATTGIIPIINGGTGAITKAAAFDALSPMTTGGDIIYGGASGTGTRLANGSSGQFLKSNGTTTAPSWSAVSFTPPLITKYTSGSGTHTFTGSPLYVKVMMVGGGSGGSGSGTASVGNSSAGGNTTFGTTLLVANGGGATSFGTGLGGVGGTASLGSGPTGVAVSGGDGSGVANALQAVGGNGGSSCLGGAGVGSGGGTAAAGLAAKTNTGSGGGGAGTGAFSGGGVGGASGAYIDAYISGATLSGMGGSGAYAVGGGTAGGTAGTAGQAGGAGAAGQIVVIEYYG